MSAYRDGSQNSETTREMNLVDEVHEFSVGIAYRDRCIVNDTISHWRLCVLLLSNVSFVPSLSDDILKSVYH